MGHFVIILISVYYIFINGLCFAATAELTRSKISPASPSITRPLVIYCRDAFAPTWGQRLKQHYGERVQIHVMPSFGLMTRLRLEQQRTPADLILGIDSTLTHELHDRNIIVKYLYGTQVLKMPIIWPETPLIPIAYGIVTILSHNDNNQTIVNLNDLARQTQKLIIPDPRLSTTGLEFLYWVANTIDDPVLFWRALKPLVMTYPKGLSSSFALFKNCKNCLTIAYSTSPTYAQHSDKKNKLNDIVALPLQAAPMQIYGLVITTTGQQHPLIDDIIAFMHSEPVQDSIPRDDHLYPVIYDDMSRFDDQLPPLPLAIIPPPLLTVKQKSDLIQQWLSAVSQN